MINKCDNDNDHTAKKAATAAEAAAAREKEMIILCETYVTNNYDKIREKKHERKKIKKNVCLLYCVILFW